MVDRSVYGFSQFEAVLGLKQARQGHKVVKIWLKNV